jgi:hypothetical protein
LGVPGVPGPFFRFIAPEHSSITDIHFLFSEMENAAEGQCVYSEDKSGIANMRPNGTKTSTTPPP